MIVFAALNYNFFNKGNFKPQAKLEIKKYPDVKKNIEVQTIHLLLLYSCLLFSGKKNPAVLKIGASSAAFVKLVV